MINVESFTIKRNIMEDIMSLDKTIDLERCESEQQMAIKVFTSGFSTVLKNFDFTFTKRQDLETQSRMIVLNKESDWTLDDQQRSINCFFPKIHTENIFLSLIFKDKYYHDIPMEKNCVYFLPSWIPYKFSTKEEKLQTIFHFWFFSDTKIKNKETGVWW